MPKKPFISLAESHPEIAAEADGWDPKTLDSSSGKKVEWKCSLGHKWSTKLNYRVSRGSKCPYCLNQKVWVGFNDFATTHPELARELVDSDGRDFVAGSFSKIQKWRCPKGHIYEAKVAYRATRNQGCPVCSGRQVLAGFNDLATTHPELAKEAYDFNPTEFSSGSHKSVKWKCPRGHIYSSVLKQRTTGNKSGCSVCSGNQVMQGVNDLATTDPELSLEAYGWDPKTITRSSNKKREWSCKFSHIWTASVNSRTNMKSGCPVCAGKKIEPGFNDLLTLFPDIARQADGWNPSIVLAGTHQKYGWVCQEGHKWKSVVKDRTSRGDGCPSCATYGFNPNLNGYLYFLQHRMWQMFQIGITNFPDDRIKSHQKLGWELVEVRGPMDGHLTQQWETAILRMLKAKGADLSNEKIAGKFDGYSEAWSKSTFQTTSIKELMKLTELFEE